MSSYRIARRAFMRSIGAGAVGLKILLRNMEASAQGAAPPPRFLMTHWPVGTQKYWFSPVAVGSNPNPTLPTLPTIAANGTNWDFSRILKPFGDAGLKNDMIVLYGLNSGGVGRFGGGHEAGTPQTTTGAPTPGTRSNGGETDDAVAGGPSWDQNLPQERAGAVPSELGRRLRQRHLRRAHRFVRDLDAVPVVRLRDARGRGRSGRHAASKVSRRTSRCMPTLSPFTFYNNVLGSVMGGTGGDQPGDRDAPVPQERPRPRDQPADAHARRWRRAASGRRSTSTPRRSARSSCMISDQIRNGSMTPAMCVKPPEPSMTLLGQDRVAQRLPQHADARRRRTTARSTR